MSKHILITNDDGISADGIRKLAEIARRLGDVTVVAPDAQRSAASHHCIFSRPLILKEYDFGLDSINAIPWMGRLSTVFGMDIRSTGRCSQFPKLGLFRHRIRTNLLPGHVSRWNNPV